MLDLLGHGRIISIDRSAQWDPQVLAHPRVSTFVGDSLDFRAPLSPNNFVILDGDHSETHVSAELDLYSQLIPIGGNLIVEDTIINHPFPIYESSPWEAVDTFLLSHPNWTITEDATRLHFSFANHGFLRRLS
jgi:cephalosporin hydroxylase